MFHPAKTPLSKSCLVLTISLFCSLLFCSGLSHRGSKKQKLWTRPRPPHPCPRPRPHPCSQMETNQQRYFQLGIQIHLDFINNSNSSCINKHIHCSVATCCSNEWTSLSKKRRARLRFWAKLSSWTISWHGRRKNVQITLTR